MTKEAMKLALEALELNNSEWKDLANSGDSGYWKAEDQGHYQLTNEAITALREALAEQPAQQEEPAGMLQEIARLHDRIKDLERDVEFLSLPAQQEPVAFFDPQSKGFYWAKPTKVIPPVTVNVEPLPLYTTPPAQRTWIGLTDEEVVNFLKAIWGRDVTPKHLIQAIEAKLKEKNT